MLCVSKIFAHAGNHGDSTITELTSLFISNDRALIILISGNFIVIVMISYPPYVFFTVYASFDHLRPCRVMTGRFHPRTSLGAPMESRARNRSQEVEVATEPGKPWGNHVIGCA